MAGVAGAQIQESIAMKIGHLLIHLRRAPDACRHSQRRRSSTVGYRSAQKITYGHHIVSIEQHIWAGGIYTVSRKAWSSEDMLGSDQN